MFLKRRGLEKVPHSKSSYSRLVFCNQLPKYFAFLVLLRAVINRKERTLTVSLCMAVVEVTQPYLYLAFIGSCLLKNDFFLLD